MIKIIQQKILVHRKKQLEAKHAFSAPGIISAKIKAEISDSSIDDLCFLQSYFQKDNLLISLSN